MSNECIISEMYRGCVQVFVVHRVAAPQFSVVVDFSIGRGRTQTAFHSPRTLHSTPLFASVHFGDMVDVNTRYVSCYCCVCVCVLARPITIYICQSAFYRLWCWILNYNLAHEHNLWTPRSRTYVIVSHAADALPKTRGYCTRKPTIIGNCSCENLLCPETVMSGNARRCARYLQKMTRICRCRYVCVLDSIRFGRLMRSRTYLCRYIYENLIYSVEWE